MTIFNRAAKRGHYPREPGMRAIYQQAGIPLPADPRDYTAFKAYDFGVFVCVRAPSPPATFLMGTVEVRESLQTLKMMRRVKKAVMYKQYPGWMFNVDKCKVSSHAQCPCPVLIPLGLKCLG